MQADSVATSNRQWTQLQKQFKFIVVQNENGTSIAYPLDIETGLFKNWAVDVTMVV